MQAILFTILQIFFATHLFWNSDIPQFWLGNSQSCDAFRPIVCKWKYLIDYTYRYPTKKVIEIGCVQFDAHEIVQQFT